jgi:hypothetical protein
VYHEKTMTRESGYVVVSILGAAFAAGVAWAFLAGSFRIAWLFAALVVLCMEGRVQLAGRLPRTALFWTHLSAAVPFFLLLTALAFWRSAPWAIALDAALFIVMIASAGVLWYQGLRAVRQPGRPT